MRTLICLLIFVVIIGSPGAYCADEGIRIIISTTGKAAYSAKKLDSPARIVVDFLTKNVLSNATGEATINKGALSKIKSEYYESSGESVKYLKSLVFYMSEDAPYRISQESDKILIDIMAPADLKKNSQLELAGSGSGDYIAKKNMAINSALAGMEKKTEFFLVAPPALKGKPRASALPKIEAIAAARVKIGWQDLLYLALLSFCILWLISIRRGWASFKKDILNKKSKITLFMEQERRKWWRHNLRPLGKNSISLEFAPLGSKEKKVKVAASNIGYGGASFKLAFLHYRLPFDKPIMVNIILPDGKSVQTEGTLIWQRGGNPFRHSFGVVFTKHLHSDWDTINKFIEDKYISL